MGNLSKTFGKAFQDQVGKGRFKYGHFTKIKEDRDWTESFMTGWSSLPNVSLIGISRKLILVAIVAILFFFLLVRLFHLQMVQGSYNRDLADSNRIQVKVIHAPRGVIYDRNGKILAQNEPGFRLTQPATDSAKPINEFLTRDQALQLEVRRDPKVRYLEIDNVRSYPFKEKTAHILGYTSQITEEELNDPSFNNYRLGDRVGRGGIEEVYEKVLKGVDGGEIIEVDAQGNKLRTLNRVEAVPGQNIYLTVDVDLQLAAFKSLEDGIKKAKVCCGALVAQDPLSGEVLSLVSLPTYDPTNISPSLTAPNFPFLNRAVAGTYPPGSTYKIASALAGLSSGKITAKTKYEDTGVMSLGPFTFANWYFTQYGRKEEGGVDVIKALKRSNDIFFYQMGHLIGEDVIADVSKKMGLGKKLGIDLPGEEEGVIPDNAWKVDNIGQEWYPGDTLHMSIGQGFVLSTPLQISNLVSQIAANGNQYPPHLALKITDSHQKLIKQFKYEGQTNKNFKQSDIDLVKKGLSEVTKNGGTAWPFFPFPIQTAGKTGTAEYGDAEKTHAWYTAYAPENDPKIAATVIIEGGGEGSSTGGPIIKEVFRWYFSDDKNNLIKDTGTIATESARTLGE